MNKNTKITVTTTDEGKLNMEIFDGENNKYKYIEDISPAQIGLNIMRHIEDSNEDVSEIDNIDIPIDKYYSSLESTLMLMLSNDYVDRFKAEFHQLYTRYRLLLKLVENWDHLDFTPTCSIDVYDKQLKYMEDYLRVLLYRANKEDVDVWDI